MPHVGPFPPSSADPREILPEDGIAVDRLAFTRYPGFIKSNFAAQLGNRLGRSDASDAFEGKRGHVRVKQPSSPHDSIRVNTDEWTTNRRSGISECRYWVDPDCVAEHGIVDNSQGTDQHYIASFPQSASKGLVLIRL